MKIISLTLLSGLLFTFASCKKDDNMPTKVTYDVECSNCTVYLNGEMPGPVVSNPTSTPILVKGSWTHTVDNPSDKTFKLHVFVDVYHGSQNVKASITTDTNKSATMNETLGGEPSAGGMYAFDKSIKLDL